MDNHLHFTRSHTPKLLEVGPCMKRIYRLSDKIYNDSLKDLIDPREYRHWREDENV